MLWALNVLTAVNLTYDAASLVAERGGSLVVNYQQRGLTSKTLKVQIPISTKKPTKQ